MNACCSNSRFQGENIMYRPPKNHEDDDTVPLHSSKKNKSTTWSLSPKLGPSSDSDLSLRLDDLHCQEGSTPRRKLQLTPELLTLSPNQSSEVSKVMTTPTGSDTREAGKGKERSGFQGCSDPKWGKNAQNPGGMSEDKASVANKENRPFRVKLSSRFSGSTAFQGLGRRGNGHNECPKAGVYSGEEQWNELATSLSELWSHTKHWPHPVDIPDSATEDKNLIGDYSKPHLFTMENGEHQDLHYISAHSVASLLNGNYNGVVVSYLIIDCRYPYEFKGGHIKGAVNFYSELQLQEALFQDTALFEWSSRTKSPSSPPTTASLPCSSAHSQGGASQRNNSERIPPESRSLPDGPAPRKLMVFHCEFSTERGPRLYRNLRKLDRCLNIYPQLFYPEIYVLNGGYKEFFSQFPDLCEPSAYIPMLHRDFREQLRKFRQRRRSSAMQHRKKQLFKSDP